MNLDLLVEAERRGILPPEKAALLAEARKRGLVGGEAPKQAQQAPQRDVGTAEGVLRSGVQGATFGFGDEITAGLAAPIAKLMGKAPGKSIGDVYGEMLNQERGDIDQFRETNKGAAVASELGGAVAAPLGAMGKLAQGGLAARSAKSAGAGAGLSGVYGFGAGEGGAGSRADNALGAAKLGGAVGALVPFGGAAIQKALNSRAGTKTIKEGGRGAKTTEALKAEAEGLYGAVDDVNATLDPSALRGATDKIVSSLRDKGLDETGGALSLTPQSARIAQLLDDTGRSNSPVPLRDVMAIRRKAGVPAGNVANKTEQALGSRAIEGIDSAIADLAPEAADTLKSAQDAYARMSRSDMLDKAVKKGSSYLSGGASGIRNQFKSILNNEKKIRGFSEAEKAAMRRVVNGSVPEQMLNLISGGIGQLGQIGGGATIGGISGIPGGAAAGAVLGAATGAASRKASEALARRNAEVARALVAKGGLKQLPKADPKTAAIIEQLTRRGAAVGVQ